MPKQHSHVSHSKSGRAYSGEKEAKDIIGWLNFRLFEDEATQRVWRLIEEVEGKRVNFRRQQDRVIEILRLYEQSRIEWEELSRHGIDSRARSSERKKMSASLELKRRLRRYTFYPQFFPLGKLLSFVWTPRRPDHPDEYGEVSAIADLAKLAEKDLLGHLRECPCGRWIWARFSHQRFCSAKCREREFQSSEKWKEHRRQKAREYNRLHKSGKVK